MNVSKLILTGILLGSITLSGCMMMAPLMGGGDDSGHDMGGMEMPMMGMMDMMGMDDGAEETMDAMQPNADADKTAHKEHNNDDDEY